MVGRRKVASRLPPRLYVTKGKRVTSYWTILPGNKWVGLGRDLIAAKKKLFELIENVVPAGTVAELIDNYLRDELRPLVAQGKRAYRTLSDRVEQAVNLKAAFGKMSIQDVTPNHVWKYLHKYRGRAAPVRANREITFLKAVYSWARDQGLIRDNPCTGVKMNEEVPRDRLVSDDELTAFIKLAREDGDISTRAALAFQIAFLTGKGQGQILRLSRSQISDEGIEFAKRKGGARVLVTWSNELRATIDESLAMPSRISPNFVVHTKTGSPYSSDGFKKGWQALMRKWVAQGGERFTFHDSRAKATTDVIEQGRKASELTGHKLESTVTKIYDRRHIRKSAPVR
jgi:integrase